MYCSCVVAPHAGAWIETQKSDYKNPDNLGSHPMRVRGLKREMKQRYSEQQESHPMRVRGLKQS